MVGILVVDFGTEVLVAALTYAFLVSNGFVPLRVLRGVAGVYHKFFMPMAAVVWLFFISFQLTHVGMDFSLEFSWLQRPEAIWSCGLKWKLV